VIVVTKDDARQCDHRRSPAQNSCCFCVMGGRPVLLKPAVAFILFQQNNELSQKIWIIFRSNCVFKKQRPHNSFPRQCAPNMNLLRNAEDFYAVDVGFQHSISYCFDSSGTMLRPYKTNCLSYKPLRAKTPYSGLQIYCGTGSKQKAVPCTGRISKCWKCSSRR